MSKIWLMLWLRKRLTVNILITISFITLLYLKELFRNLIYSICLSFICLPIKFECYYNFSIFIFSIKTKFIRLSNWLNPYLNMFYYSDSNRRHNIQEVLSIHPSSIRCAIRNTNYWAFAWFCFYECYLKNYARYLQQQFYGNTPPP